MRIFDRYCAAVAIGAGLCGVASAFSPDALATPLRTGGAGIEQQAGFGAAPIAAAPVVLPGPVPIVPIAPVLPAVPPVPPVVPVVPIAGGAGAAGGAPVAAPIVMAAGTGKGAPVTPSAGKTAEPVVFPGPVVPAAAELPPE